LLLTCFSSHFLLDGTITYVPGQDFVGTDSLLYEIGDGNGNTAKANVVITVVDPTRPVAVDDTADTTENQMGK
jgi:hypothetical protein